MYYYFKETTRYSETSNPTPSRALETTAKIWNFPGPNSELIIRYFMSICVKFRNSDGPFHFIRKFVVWILVFYWSAKNRVRGVGKRNK